MNVLTFVICTLLLLSCSLARKLRNHHRTKKSSIRSINNGYFYEDYDLTSDNTDVRPVGTNIEKELGNHLPSYAFPRSVTSALHDFSFDLFDAMRPEWEQDQNVAISPLSIYVALGMVAAGTGGRSREQALKVMNANSMKNIHLHIKHLLKSIVKEEEAGYSMSVANRVFIARKLRLMKPYKSILKHDYNSSAKKVDFFAFPEKSRGKINQFVNKQTQGKIRQIAPEGTIDSMTQLYIVNALYLKAAWQFSFDQSRTKLQDFNYAVGRSTRVLMMRSSSGQCNFEIMIGMMMQIVRIKLKGGLSMVVLMPLKPGDFSNLEGSNGKNNVRKCLERLYGRNSWPSSCVVTMPKFTVDHEADNFIEAQKRLGLVDIFDPNFADLSNLTPNDDNLYVKDARHKTSISVTEYGIEAAAVTSYGISSRMVPMEVGLTKPFMFIIRHDDTGANLFTGRIIKPTV